MIDLLLPSSLRSWAFVAPVMFLLWLWSRRKGEADIVDLGWTLAIGAQGVAWAVLGDGDPLRRATTGAIAALWSSRLAYHLWTDRVLRPGEDARYADLREYLGPRAGLGFFAVFQVNALLSVLLATAPLIAAQGSAAFGTLDVVAVLLFVVSFGGESLADHQLARFKRRSDAKGRTCREGLWRYSRHPNYFFEWLHWLAYPLLAIAGWGLGPEAAWALVPAVIMYVLLVHVSGIPHSERRAVANRGDDYRRYQASTSAFFPWFADESADRVLDEKEGA